jgi:hypothetical protein
MISSANRFGHDREDHAPNVARSLEKLERIPERSLPGTMRDVELKNSVAQGKRCIRHLRASLRC